MVALYTCWYSFVKMHKTVGMTPATAASVTDALWVHDRPGGNGRWVRRGAAAEEGGAEAEGAADGVGFKLRCPMLACSFCGTETAWDSAPPAICPDCLGLCRDIIEGVESDVGDEVTCSFCGTVNRRSVAGPTVYICQACVSRLSGQESN